MQREKEKKNEQRVFLNSWGHDRRRSGKRFQKFERRGECNLYSISYEIYLQSENRNYYENSILIESRFQLKNVKYKNCDGMVF